MRKIVGWLLVALGAFLLATAVIATAWVPDRVEKTPLDTDSTTRLDGTATVLPSGTGNFDVRATSITRADSNASDDDVVVFENHTCLVLDVPGVPDCGVQGTGDEADERVVSISSDFFATDRHTGLATNEEGYLPEGTPDHEGLINKFPFGTVRADYPFWDSLLKEAVTAKYEDTESLDGLETYRFSYTVTDQPAEIAADIEGTYSMEKTMWIEPTTGAIIDQEQHDVRAVDGQPVLDLRLSFTDEQVETNVADAKDNSRTIKLFTDTVPLLGFIAGPILLVLGVILLLLNRRSGQRAR